MLFRLISAGQVAAVGARRTVEHDHFALIDRGRAAAKSGRADQDVAEAVVVEVAARGDRETQLGWSLRSSAR